MAAGDHPGGKGSSPGFQLYLLIVLVDVGAGAYELASFGAADILRAKDIIKRYADRGLGPGLADASIVVLAERYGCLDLLSLDQRHVRSISGPNRKPFRLLPPASP